jgi:hypothetical protein
MNGTLRDALREHSGVVVGFNIFMAINGNICVSHLVAGPVPLGAALHRQAKRIVGCRDSDFWIYRRNSILVACRATGETRVDDVDLHMTGASKVGTA